MRHGGRGSAANDDGTAKNNGYAMNAGRENRTARTARVKAPMILKRSIVLKDRKTCVSLEEPFWLELRSIAAERKLTLGELISMIDAGRKRPNLSSALRLFVLAKYRPGALGWAHTSRHR